VGLLNLLRSLEGGTRVQQNNNWLLCSSSFNQDYQTFIGSKGVVVFIGDVLKSNFFEDTFLFIYYQIATNLSMNHTECQW
jgi:hypothetical protein